jgi:transposase
LYGGRGRIPYDDQPFFRAAVGKSFLQIPTTDKLINRLRADANFKRICGFHNVPSAATFSRRFATFAEIAVMDQTLNAMVRRHLEGRLIGHILRDAPQAGFGMQPFDQLLVRRDLKERLADESAKSGSSW